MMKIKVSYPFDVLRKRMQAQRHFLNNGEIKITRLVFPFLFPFIRILIKIYNLHQCFHVHYKIYYFNQVIHMKCYYS